MTNMYSKITLLLLFCGTLLFNANAQKIGIPGIDYRACSSAQKNNEIINSDPAIQQVVDKMNQEALDWTAKNYGKSNPSGKKVISYVIPVVWHVIHNNGPENISRATIESEIAKLNEDYQKRNADIVNAFPMFAPIAADIEVEFRLARLDPDGNCTEGITRTVDPITYAMDETAKTIAPSWNRNGRYYLNIWQGTAIASGAGGYAFYPGTVALNKEGLVLIAGQLGNTVSHETGHFFNLMHPWGNTNNPGPGQTPDNCTVDDGVADTPNTEGQSGCLATSQSCGSIDNVQNYMDYNFCDVMFTEGQKQRMHAALNSATGKRSSLWSPTNLANTGIADPYVQNPSCTLMGADFTHDKTKICEGEQVTFHDANTYNGTPTQWSWTFAGGTPNVSSLESPIVTYNTAGVYGATYAPGNAAGFITPVSKSNIITVSTLTAQYLLPFSEDLENVTSYNTNWTVETQSGNGWQNVATAAYSGSRSVYINNRSNAANDVSELISSSFDLTSMTSPQLIFKSAFAKKATGSSNDQLIIYSSIDCGASWQIRTVKTASYLSSLSVATDAVYVPSSTAEWKESIVSLSSLATQPNVRLKFYFKNNGGNNIYIDDININGSVGVEETKSVSNFSVFPNPTSESATVSFSIPTDVKVLKITLKDVLGKEITNIVNGQSFTAGKYNMSVDKGKKLASGLYFVEFNADNKVKIEKLIVK